MIPGQGVRFPILLLLLAPASSAVAQAKCLDQIKLPAQGRWAEYQATFKNDSSLVRYSVVGHENRGGKDLKWVEMRMQGGKRQTNMIYQVLIPRSLTEMAQVQEIVFKPGDKPAMKMSGPMMQMIRGELEKQSFYGDICKGVSLVGREKVTVPAGTFLTLHFKSNENATDSWLAPNAPFSLVKATGKNFQVELAAEGQGATSSIKEKPQGMGRLGGPSR
jgi:hypothetical protein